MPAATGGLQAQIFSLGETMQNGFAEMKGMLQGIETRVRAIENHESGCQPLVTSKLDAAWRKLDEHDVTLKDLKTTVVEISHTNRILKWILGVVTSIFTALFAAIVLMLVSGQLTLAVK